MECWHNEHTVKQMRELSLSADRCNMHAISMRKCWTTINIEFFRPDSVNSLVLEILLDYRYRYRISFLVRDLKSRWVLPVSMASWPTHSPVLAVYNSSWQLPLTCRTGIFKNYITRDSVGDPDPNRIRIKQIWGSGSEFRIRIRIHTGKNSIN